MWINKMLSNPLREGRYKTLVGDNFGNLIERGSDNRLKTQQMNEIKFMLKEINSGKTFVIEEGEDFEKYTIQLLRENNYSVNQMAKFFGINQRAMYYRLNKLGFELGSIKHLKN